MKLKKIDLYCQERGHSRSKFMVNCALGVINATGGKIKCDYCGKPAIGRFKFTTYDYQSGEAGGEKNMCQYHYNKAKQEGVEFYE